MGVLDLFTILAGGAWLTKETFREVDEHGAEQYRTKLINEFIAQHSDIELERQLQAQIENPACYDEIWQRLELFKRDNPVWCKERESKPEYLPNSTICLPAQPGWQDVGVQRLPFRDEYGYLTPANQRLAHILSQNRTFTLIMLMETYDKMTLSRARQAANKKYPIAPSKRKW